MAELQPPVALQNVSTLNADDLRGLIEALVPTEGVAAAGDLAVTANGTPNMSVNVAAGAAIIKGDDTPATQGSYFVKNDATKNLTIAAADATNPRKDIVVAQVRDQFYAGSDNDWRLAVITGTPAASPTEPALPNNSLKLATVDVAAAAASITSGAITDTRTTAAGLAGVPNAAWTAYTPTLTQGGSVAKTVTYARYIKIGRMVTVNALLAVTGSGTAGQRVEVGLPVAAAHTSFLGGTLRVYNASGPNNLIGAATIWTSTTVAGICHNDSQQMGQSGSDFNSGLASGDFVSLDFTYEAAA